MPSGNNIAAKAATVAQDYKTRGVTYVYGADASGGGTTSDCSHFVADVLGQAGLSISYVTTTTISTSSSFQNVVAAKAQAGDVIVQGGHMGVYSGEVDAQKHPKGYQMGNSGAALGIWGPGGWFKKPEDLRYYRANGLTPG